MALVINKSNFETEVLNSEKPVLLDFWASWCGPCMMLSPTIEEIAAEHPEYKVGKINVDEEAELTEQFGIVSIPALFVVKNGKVVNKGVGLMPKEKVLAMLK